MYSDYLYETQVANHNFLRDSLIDNNTFYCSHDPSVYFSLASQTVKNASTFAKELEYIIHYYNYLGITIAYSDSITICNQTVWKIIIVEAN